MKNWKGLLKTMAPTLATAMGGPLAGMATKAVTAGLLGKDDCSDSEIYEALMSPDGVAKLKKIEADFEVKMKELDIDLERISAEDRKSARKMAVDTTLVPQIILSAIVIVGFFYFSGYVVELELDPSQSAIVNQIIGALILGLGMVLRFWFGGGPSDKEIQKTLAESIPPSRVKK